MVKIRDVSPLVAYDFQEANDFHQFYSTHLI